MGSKDLDWGSVHSLLDTLPVSLPQFELLELASRCSWEGFDELDSSGDFEPGHCCSAVSDYVVSGDVVAFSGDD